MCNNLIICAILYTDIKPNPSIDVIYSGQYTSYLRVVYDVYPVYIFIMPIWLIKYNWSIIELKYKDMIELSLFDLGFPLEHSALILSHPVNLIVCDPTQSLDVQHTTLAF